MIKLLIGTDKIKVDTEDIANVSIKYALKDIKNYGSRNISYTKSIKVYRNKQTETIFKGLHNIDVIDGYDISKSIAAELVENGVTILKGILQVVEVHSTYYKVVVTSPQFNLFDKMGSNLITGNEDTDLDISFADDYHAFTYSRDNIRAELAADPSEYGVGYQLAIVDYDNTIDKVDDIITDYPILPNIAALEVWNAIFAKYGYTYELSEDISTYLSHLYIPFNDDRAKYVINWNYANWKLGSPIDPSWPANPYSSYQPVYLDNGVTGVLYNTLYNYSGNTYGRTLEDATNFDDQLDLTMPYTDNQGYFEIYTPGSYNINVNLAFSPAYSYDPEAFSGWDARFTVNMDVSINILRNGGWIYNPLTQFSDADLTASDSVSYYSDTIEDITLIRGDKVYINIQKTEETDKTVGITAWVPEWTWVIKDPATNVNFTLNNSFLGDNTVFTMNDMLPRGYAQSDFINDIFKMFNVYVEMDKDDPNNIIIKSYNTYFSEGTTIDWTDKVDNEDINFDSIKNVFAQKTTFKYSEDEDIFNQDFTYKYNNNFGTNTVINDSEIASNTNEIKISTSPTILKTISFEY